MWDTLLVAILVAAAGIYLLRRWRTAARGKGCGSCCAGCPAPTGSNGKSRCGGPDAPR